MPLKRTFALLATLIACLVPTTSVALGAELGRHEAENFNRPAGVSVVNDSTASGDRALKFTASATATKRVTTSAYADTVVVVARGPFHEGRRAELEIKLDGTTRNGNGTTLDSSTYKGYAVAKGVPAGSYTLGIRAENATSNRPLYADVYVLRSSSVEPAPEPAPKPAPEPAPEPTVATKTYPSDAVIDVATRYGATPNGGADDTAAIQKAISDNLGTGASIYLPPGTYHVSDTLDWRKPGGEYYTNLTLLGAGSGQTTIRLKDGSAGFGAGNDKPVIETATEYTTACAVSPRQTGGGNCAFRNNIENLTVDAGDNPGAEGIEYLANNWGAMRDVVIRGNGTAGLDLTESWPGPALVQDVTVEGFARGVDVTHKQYSMTFEHLTLSNQRSYGIHNNGNALAIRDLVSTQSSGVPAIHQPTTDALTTLTDATLVGGGVTGTGEYYAENVNGVGATFSAYDQLFPSTQRSLGLPVQETPDPHPAPADWANVNSFGATAGSGDDTAAIQAAVDSGADAIYFPAANTGRDYHVKDTVQLRDSVNLVYGNHIRLKALPGGSVAAGGPFFNHSGAEDVRVEKILIQSGGVAGTENSHAFESSTSAKLAMVDNGCPVLRPWLEGCYKGTAGDGPAFMENQRGEDYVVAEGQKFFARQLNLEGDVSTAGLKNQGGQAWVLGIKTEGGEPAVKTTAGGQTEVLGGLVFPVSSVGGNVPVMEDVESETSYSFVTHADSLADNYDLLVKEVRGGVTREFRDAEAEPRATGSAVVPLFSGH